MRSRILQVTFDIDGDKTVLNDAASDPTASTPLSIRARIKKNCFKMQSSCTLEIVNLSKTVREKLLSRMTAWDARMRNEGREEQRHIKVEVKAGYAAPSIPGQTSEVRQEPSTVFTGEAAIVELISGPPDIAVRVQCFTNQVDRSQFKTGQSPARATVAEYVRWISKQMEMPSDPIIDTIKANDVLTNPGQSCVTRIALLTWLQSLYGPEVYVFADNGQIIVKDANKLVDTDNITTYTEFLAIPMWNEWGVSFTTLYDPTLKLASPAQLDSKLNPAVNGGVFIVYILEYDLSSRGKEFSVTAFGSPAGQVQKKPEPIAPEGYRVPTN
ncbi:hypothetical protein LGM35_06420 [Burkholderia cenocepacia]|uniref:baseplate hub protein n=1 Tax=Burkholderia cenocepacia TaxID=95486 RepID=UPI001CF18EA3|nr:hypothetical protein [Burkholderia cenocepacia]MCA7922115.1 hypothetical protein [Burkholderia cenocepacia]